MIAICPAALGSYLTTPVIFPGLLDMVPAPAAMSPAQLLATLLQHPAKRKRKWKGALLVDAKMGKKGINPMISLCRNRYEQGWVEQRETQRLL
ncbi:hypothetical protein IVG45_01010 [Methylomonas sp. LL1]|uniref:hypothetical protein n=1 Tax=Methylomonas sp. LL1 TaxID=2785785 RepID=UPI0018C3C8E2|nr:hypothetical protein [Methylomonas sp. LL1]QPK63596.1 hypothetical protein IVG45_01010 [Methylomonas sp. LL1]